MYFQFKLNPDTEFVLESISLLCVQQIFYYWLGIQIFYKTFFESCVFATLESLLYKWEDGYFFTTYQQFFCNLLALPLMIDFVHYMIDDIWLRILLFPFSVWTYEYVTTIWLRSIFGKNPCWTYLGKDGSLFEGAICVNSHYYVRWMALGALAECWGIV
jgi:hypothetical protein